MSVDVSRVPVEEILDLRELYRAEMSCQIVHDSLHQRGFTHCYSIRVSDRAVGYGCVIGFGDEPKETVNEFFILRDHRGSAPSLFQRFVEACGATRVQAQTNDPLLTLMLFDSTVSVEREKVLFHDAFTSRLSCEGATFRRTTDEDRGRSFQPRPEDVGDWLVEKGGEIVATGGVLFHYNPPYGDMFMEVAEDHRRHGYGSLLVQELKRVCREMGKKPAARCDPANAASRATLQRAGLLPCAVILSGELEWESNV